MEKLRDSIYFLQKCSKSHRSDKWCISFLQGKSLQLCKLTFYLLWIDSGYCVIFCILIHFVFIGRLMSLVQFYICLCAIKPSLIKVWHVVFFYNEGVATLEALYAPLSVLVWNVHDEDETPSHNMAPYVWLVCIFLVFLLVLITNLMSCCSMP